MSTLTLSSFVQDAWVTGTGALQPLFNPSTEELLAQTGTGGIDFGAALEHARRVGGPGLRSMTYAQRGEALRALSKTLHAHRDELIGLAMTNGGNTRGDAKFDIDGAIGTLAHYADLGAQLGNLKVLRDGDSVQLGRTARYAGVHLWTPKTGAAVHINAFNFPAWGTAEKLACAILAGMPVLSKPATSSALVAWRLSQLCVETKALPPGAFTFLCGSTGDLLDRLTSQDVCAFTGSSKTAGALGGKLWPRGVRFNVEADSLNSALLGPDVEVGSPAWDIFIADVARDLSQKAGQKCTAIRRIFVPGARLPDVRDALIERLSAVRVGDPARSEVTMGPVATADQQRDVKAGIARLLAEAKVVHGGADITPLAADPQKGYFVGPTLLECALPAQASILHKDEVFGPCATLCVLADQGTQSMAEQAVH
ncbi:MAG: 3,4-dehydroadipyl-CoA semialdehyde dehydrogenase, partial [Deltaproteobacteria bacterium]|nr:3,4-dehydroadipyl-CoA semialdehyde dehydrogenase [Deltaproteobacteria bacterium]